MVVVGLIECAQINPEETNEYCMMTHFLDESFEDDLFHTATKIYCLSTYVGAVFDQTSR